VSVSKKALPSHLVYFSLNVLLGYILKKCIEASVSHLVSENGGWSTGNSMPTYSLILLILVIGMVYILLSRKKYFSFKAFILYGLKYIIERKRQFI
jgi:hypothetical protein